MIKTLFIDLDDTVYPPGNGIWPLLGDRIYRYMLEKVGIPEQDIVEIRERLLDQYGSTINGLRAEYATDLHDYLAYVHDEDLSPFLRADDELRTALKSLPQEKWVFTNASKGHAEQVLALLGIRDLFVGIIDLADTDPYCKPHASAFSIALQKAGNPIPEECFFVDDRAVNLDSAKKLGLHTLLVAAQFEGECAHPRIEKLSDLPLFLVGLESKIKEKTQPNTTVVNGE